MTNREYVIRGARLLGLEVIGPKGASRDILLYRGTELVVDAPSWAKARQLLDAWNLRRTSKL